MRNSVIFLSFFFSSLLVSVCSTSIYANGRSDSLLKKVDKVVRDKKNYELRRESTLNELRKKAEGLPKGDEKFRALGELMNEYMDFNTDSAYNVLLQMEDYATETGDSLIATATALKRARLMMQVALYPETLNVLQRIDPNKLTADLLPDYYYIKRTLYGRLGDYSLFKDDKEEYERLTYLYLDSLLRVLDKDNVYYTLAKADKLNLEGRPQEAIKILSSYIDNDTLNTLSEHEIAIVMWTRSEAYRLAGDEESRKQDIIQASISDLKAGVKEYISLRELAFILHEEGDTKRAYDFVRVAMEDAEACNARQRIIELHTLYPIINEIYIDKINQQKKTLGWFIAIVSLLSVGMLASWLFTKREMKKVNQSRQQLEKVNDELDKMNFRLQKSNGLLNKANKEIAENSMLKEVYIGKYMDQCMGYIDKIDSLKKTTVNMLNMNKVVELKKLAKSSAGINDELKIFYDQFDRTFLSLFPNFVNQVNQLLQPGETLLPKTDESLSPELRILALIRLGVTDSEKIAKFLHYSLTTIYNYRTRIRNKARGDRNTFEDEVKNIGRIDSTATE